MDAAKKAIRDVVIATDALFSSMKTADEEIMGGGECNNGLTPSHTITINNESHSLMAELLRGEVTQQVREARYEMYMADRKSTDYEYNGNGRVKKRTPVTMATVKVDKTDGLEPYVIQRNREDTGGVEDAKLNVSANGTKDHRDFTIQIARDFTPRFRIEEWASMIVIKKRDDGKAVLDIYTTKYESQFNRRHKPFLNEIEYIRQRGAMSRSEILEMKGLSFTTFNAVGAKDLKVYEFNNITFSESTEYDGSYVLRFIADFVKDGADPIMEKYYDAEADRKSKEHEPRKNAAINLYDVMVSNAEDEYDADTADELSGLLGDSRPEDFEYDISIEDIDDEQQGTEESDELDGLDVLT